jgi:outer membrane protein TolC
LKAALLFLSCAVLTACNAAPSPPRLANAADWIREREAGFDRALVGETEGLPRAPAELSATLATGQREITLVEVVQLVEAQGLDLQIARERLAAAEAEEDIAHAAWWPHLSVGASLYRNDGQVQATSGDFLEVDKRSAWAGGEARLEFDLGAAIYGTRAASRRTEAKAHEAQGAADDAVTLAALYYFDLVESFARLGLAAEARLEAASLVALEQARLKAGSGLAASLARAQAHEAAVASAAIRARVGVERASARLVELLQLSPGDSLTPGASALAALDLVAGAWQPEAGQASSLLLELALWARPELRAAESRLAASEAEEARADFAWILPEFMVAARVGSLGQDYNDADSQNVYTAALRWDLGAKLLGERNLGRSHRRQAQLEHALVKGQVQREVRIAAAEYGAAQLAIAASEREVEAATLARDLARERHEHGAALFVEVLDSQMQFLRAHLARVAALADFNRAQFSLLRASGLWSTSAERR